LSQAYIGYMIALLRGLTLYSRSWFGVFAKFVILLPVGVRNIAISVSVCLSVCLFVCLLAYLKNHMSKYHLLLFFIIITIFV